MDFDPLDSRERPSQSIDPAAAIGVGIALNALRSIAAGSGSLKLVGESIVGTLNEYGQEISVRVTKENFFLDENTLLLEEGNSPSERLKEVTLRIFELASIVASGKNHEDPDFTILCEEILGYNHDQQQMQISFFPMETLNLGAESGDFQQRVSVDHEATILRLTPLFEEEISITSGALSALRESFKAQDKARFSIILDTLDERYQRHMKCDRSADSRWGSCYLSYSRIVTTPGDMERLVHFDLRRDLVSTLFSIYCELYGSNRQEEKQKLGELLARVFVKEASEGDNVEDVLPQTLMLEKVAVAELSLAAFKKLYIGYDLSLYRGNPLGKLTHNLYFHALEGACGQLIDSVAVSEGRSIRSKISQFPNLQGLQDYAFNTYLNEQDLVQVKSWSKVRTHGDKCARSYRNACIAAVEEVERLKPDHLIHINQQERVRQDGTVMLFSDFIEYRKKLIEA